MLKTPTENRKKGAAVTCCHSRGATSVTYAEICCIVCAIICWCALCHRVWCPPGRTDSRTSGSARNPPGEIDPNSFGLGGGGGGSGGGVESICINTMKLTVSLPVLQLASVILKQYVETHWCSQSEKFRPPETTDQVSSRFRSPSPQFVSTHHRVIKPNRPLSHRTPGQSRHQRAAAGRPAGGHQQSALQRGVRRVGHCPLGLARGLAAALHPADGDAGQRGCQCCARGHEGPHRSVATVSHVHTHQMFLF